MEIDMNNDNRNPRPNTTTTHPNQSKHDDHKKAAGAPGEHDKKESKKSGDTSQASQK